jgi:NTP pyrophosphatase (non-canonical NTP hydrolase)
MKDGFTDIVIEFEEDVLFQLMLIAHERDITLNQLVNEVLREFIEVNKNV